MIGDEEHALLLNTTLLTPIENRNSAPLVSVCEIPQVRDASNNSKAKNSACSGDNVSFLKVDGSTSIASFGVLPRQDVSALPLEIIS